MKKASYNILRVGVAITFLWIGILILQNPAGWGAYMQPWAAKFLVVPLNLAMIAASVLDIVVGFFLLIGTYVWLAALIGALHLLVVLVVSGITEITIRDIAIFAGTLALTVNDWPKKPVNAKI